jgi:hypothetical protein
MKNEFSATHVYKTSSTIGGAIFIASMATYFNESINYIFFGGLAVFLICLFEPGLRFIFQVNRVALIIFGVTYVAQVVLSVFIVKMGVALSDWLKVLIPLMQGSVIFLLVFWIYRPKILEAYGWESKE